jgi:hypothetical protein
VVVLLRILASQTPQSAAFASCPIFDVVEGVPSRLTVENDHPRRRSHPDDFFLEVTLDGHPRDADTLDLVVDVLLTRHGSPNVGLHDELTLQSGVPAGIGDEPLSVVVYAWTKASTEEVRASIVAAQAACREAVGQTLSVSPAPSRL